MMNKQLIVAAIAAVSLLAQADAHACSPRFVDYDPPEQDLGYDPVESPADPVIVSAQSYESTVDDNVFGCGGSSCGGLRSTRTHLRAESAPTDVDLIRVEYDNGDITYARFTSWDTSLIEAERHDDVTVPYDVTISYYDLDGYESGRVTVNVTTVTDEIAKAKSSRGLRSLLALCVVIGLVGVQRRRRR